MFGWLKNIFKKEPITPDRVLHDDPNVRAVVSRAANTGNIVFGNVDENGNLHITEIKKDE